MTRHGGDRASAAGSAWATPFAMTRRVYVVLAGLVGLGVVAVLGGAGIRAARDPAFRPDWTVWVPVTLGVGIAVLALAGLAVLAQRRPAKPFVPAGPLPPPTGLEALDALRDGRPLTPEQRAALPEALRGRRLLIGWSALLTAAGLGLAILSAVTGAWWTLVFGLVIMVMWGARLGTSLRLLRRARRAGSAP